MIIFGKRIRNRYLLLGDILLSLVSVLGSYLIRLELLASLPDYYVSMLWMLGVTVIIKPLVYFFFGIYRRLWRYASIRELLLIMAAVTTASVFVSGTMLGLFSSGVFLGFPRGVLVIDLLLSMAFVGGLRFTFRLIAENSSTAANNSAAGSRRKKWVLVIGAGDAGAMVVRELQKNPQLNVKPIGFLDDDPMKQNSKIHGIPVLAPLDKIDAILESHQVDEVIIAIPSAAGKVLRKVTEVCRNRGVAFRTMPGLYELLDGAVSVSRLREVDISDLLRREPVRMDTEALGEVLEGRRVLVTGAGGSIGRELCRQIAQLNPGKLLMLGHGENSIFGTLMSLKESFPSLEIVPLIADVRDLPRLSVIFERWQPEVIFHTAAHKHVPLMETAPRRAVVDTAARSGAGGADRRPAAARAGQRGRLGDRDAGGGRQAAQAAGADDDRPGDRTTRHRHRGARRLRGVRLRQPRHAMPGSRPTRCRPRHGRGRVVAADGDPDQRDDPDVAGVTGRHRRRRGDRRRCRQPVRLRAPLAAVLRDAPAQPEQRGLPGGRARRTRGADHRRRGPDAGAVHQLPVDGRSGRSAARAHRPADPHPARPAQDGADRGLRRERGDLPVRHRRAVPGRRRAGPDPVTRGDRPDPVPPPGRPVAERPARAARADGVLGDRRPPGVDDAGPGVRPPDPIGERPRRRRRDGSSPRHCPLPLGHRQGAPPDEAHPPPRRRRSLPPQPRRMIGCSRGQTPAATVR